MAHECGAFKLYGLRPPLRDAVGRCQDRPLKPRASVDEKELHAPAQARGRFSTTSAEPADEKGSTRVGNPARHDHIIR